ncbi:MAG: hypothetical protein LUC16_03420 [Coprobacillus sp.]|nr:hypothetical protein [Coprobacillus sp.]
MKKSVLLVSLLAVSSLSSCTTVVGKKDDGGSDNDAVVSGDISIELKGLDAFYLPTDTIEWENVYLLVTPASGKNSVSLTKGEFDVDAPTNEETEFVLNTSGLYTYSNSGSLIPEGDYDISYYFVYDETEYSGSFTSIAVTEYPSSLYVVFYFLEPDFVTAYKDNLANRVSDNEEAGEDTFYEGCEYTVGDDNPFIFKPTLQLFDKSLQYVVADSYAVNAALYLENEDGSRTNVIDDTEYVTYSSFSFQFTEAAIGHTFTVEMSPKYFTHDLSNNPLEPVTFTFNVEDGYNAYTGLDLDMINAAPEDIEYEWNGLYDWYITYDTMISDQSILYDPEYKYTHTPYDPKVDETNGKENYPCYCPFPYADVWNNFFEERGIEAHYINGLYMHGDIKLSMDDFPDEYKISKEEAEYTYCYDYQTGAYQRSSMDYEEMIGSLRDKTILFNHFMADDFTFNGNLFTLDCSDIRWCRTYATGEISSTPQFFDESKDNNAQGGCFLFCFSGTFVSYNYPQCYRTASDEEGETAYLVNLSARGNLDLSGTGANFPRPDSETSGSTNSRRAGTIMFCSSSGTHTVVNNVIAKEFLIGFYARHANELYTCLEINHTKLYDTYAAGCYSYNGGLTKISNSELKRFGAPALMAVSNKRFFTMTGHNADDSSSYLKDGFGACTYELDNVNIDNTLQGGEYFFVSYGITEIVPYIMEFDSVFNGGNIEWIKDFLGNYASLVSNAEFNAENYGKTYITEYTGTSGDSNTAVNALYTGMDEYITASSASIQTTDLFLDYKSSSGGGFTIDYRNTDETTDNLAYVIEQFYEYSEMSLSGALPLFATNTGKIFTIGVAGSLTNVDSYLFDVKDALNDDTDETKSMLNIALIGSATKNHDLSETEEGGLDEDDTELLFYYRYNGMAIAVVLSLYDTN